ncbi:MAG TPA: hypothetical protein ENJ20_06110 [Bacteroidetes bacterium]|nr:hypothetical protein [Bacteroidota bacterium]
MELIWWAVTLIAVVGVLYPIYKTGAAYPFWITNIIFIVVTFTLTRYIFLLKHTFLGFRQWAKVIVAVLCIPLFMYLLDELNLFRAIADGVELEELFDHLSLKGQTKMANYVKSEMLFFGAASVICSVLMPIRMVVSFWRTHNRGTT